MRDRHAEILVGVHWRVVDADFVVKVWTRRTSAQSDISNRIAPADVLPGDYSEVRKVAITRADAVSVIDHHRATVAAHEISEGDCPIGRSHDWLPNTGRNIDAAMKRAFTVEWIDALAKGSGHDSLDRPQ